MKKKLLLTGATGHLGNVLLRRLALEDYDIRILVLPGEETIHINDLDYEKVVGDISNESDVFKAISGCDYVFHLASMISIEKGKRELLRKVNIEGTEHIVNACLKYDVKRLLYVSSVHALTEPPMGTSFVENTDYNPDMLLGDYAWSKAHASLNILKGIDQGLNTVIVYPSGIIGPHDYQASNNIVGQIRDFMQKPSNEVIRYFEGAYDYVDVRDVVDGIMKAFEKGYIGDSFLLTGEKITVKEMYQTFMTTCNKPMQMKPISYNLVKAAAHVSELFARLTKRKPSITTYSVEVLKSNADFDNTYTRERLNYHPRSFKASISDTIKWLQE